MKDKSILEILGGAVTRGRYWIIALGVVLLVTSVVLGTGTIGKLSLSRWEVPGSESHQAGQTLERQFDHGSPNMVLLVTAKRGSIDSKEMQEAGLALTEELASEDAVQYASSYWKRAAAPKRYAARMVNKRSL